MPFQFDPEVGAAFLNFLGGKPPPEPAPIGDVQARRDSYGDMLAYLFGLIPTFDDVSQTDFYTKTADGHELLMRWYFKTDAAPSDSPAVLYIHGGGMIALNASLYDKQVRAHVHHTSVPFLSVDYRLAPEFPAPVPVEDCYTALSWFHSNVKKLGVDPTRIAVMGDSAGGGLAASLAHFALKKKGPKIAKQILIYPMLDDRNIEPDPHLDPFATWGYKDNATGWQAYLGSKCGKEGVLPEEAAARMTVADAKDLPEMYIDVGELDIFRNENIEYARKCTLAGVSTELHVYPGVPHGWQQISPEADVSKRAMENRMKAITSIKSV